LAVKSLSQRVTAVCLSSVQPHAGAGCKTKQVFSEEQGRKLPLMLLDGALNSGLTVTSNT